MGKGGGKGGGGAKTPQIASVPGLAELVGPLGALSSDALSFTQDPYALPNLAKYGQGYMQGPTIGSQGQQVNMQPIQLAEQGISRMSDTAGGFQRLADQASGFTQYGMQQTQAGYGQAGDAETQQFLDYLQTQGSMGQTLADYLQTQGYAGMAGQAYGQTQNALAQTQALESGTGLYPSQQAYVDQAVKSGQSAVQQQLASEGLTSSTQNAMLQNQVAESGAATAGQLIQGNIGLSQTQQQLGQSQQGLFQQLMGLGMTQQQIDQAQTGLGMTQQQIDQNREQLGLQRAQLGQSFTLGEQGLGQGAQQSIANLWQAAAKEWGGINQQGFAQSLGGYGMIGQFLQGALQPYGYQLQDYQLQLQRNIDNAQLKEQTLVAEQQAQSQGSSSMFGALGSILGGGGGGGGGGKGLGSLFGAGAGAAGAGVAGVSLGIGGAGAAAGGTTAAVEAVGLAFTAVCWVAREVYGINNPAWLQFRTWLLFKAPKWFLRMYLVHGESFSTWLRDKPGLKFLVAKLMDLVR